MAWRDAAFDEGRAGGQRQRGLSDVVVGVGLEHGAEFLDLGLAGGRADQHAVAARTVDFLDDELVHVRQHVLQVFGLAAQVGGHVVQDGLFAEVELDHLGHVGVDALVVGDAGADRIAQRDVAGAVDVQQPGAPQGAVGAEDAGVEEVVVDTAVDHVHALGALGGAHVDEAVAHHQVLALDQLHPHLLGQEGVLEVSAVVHARGQHHHGRLVHTRRRHAAQGFEQQVGVVRHRCHAVQAEQLGEQPHHHLAVLQHVAHAAGHAQVVFEHVVLAGVVGRVFHTRGAHDVDARDVRIDVARHRHAHHLLAELAVVQHLFGGHHAGLEDLLVVVDVVDEAVQRRDALDESGFHVHPLVLGDDARDQVEGDQPLGARPVLVLCAVDGEGDADAAEDHLGFFAPRLHGGARLAVQPGLVATVLFSNLCRGAGHFVEGGLHGSVISWSSVRRESVFKRKQQAGRSRPWSPPPAGCVGRRRG